jgi:3-methyladenine DNA glycosylase/8-oxoguanine DNA glycosylase
VSKSAVGEQVENVADDHDRDVTDAAAPVDGESIRPAADADGYEETIENIIRAEVSGKAASAAAKRSRSAPAPNRTKATKANAKKGHRPRR